MEVGEPSTSVRGARISSRLTVVSKLVVVAFLSTIALTIPAWFDARAFPTAPLLNVTPLPCEASLALLLLLAGSLVVLFFRPQSVPARIVMVGMYGAFVLFDQSRLMPYLLQYVVMLLILGWGEGGSEERRRSVVALCQLILFSVYLWAGVQKINISFVLHGFPWFIEPFIGTVPEDYQIPVLLGGLLVPVIESGLALLLLSNKGLRLGVLGLTAMHLFVLLCLGPLGHNWNHAVWPWNIVMICSLWMFFDSPLRLHPLRRAPVISGVVALFYLFLPALNLVGLWDDYLSHSLYSRRAARAILEVAPDDIARLPKELHAGFLTRADGRIEFSLVNYSMLNLGLPVYPAERVLEQVAKEICRRYSLSSDTTTVVYGKPDRRSGKTRHRYSPCG